MLTLYTKQNCAACERVKLVIADKGYKIEVREEYQPYSATYPTLITDWGYITDSHKIIDFLATIKHD